MLPYRGTILQIDRNAKIILKSNLLLNYYPTYKRGNQRSLLKIAKNGTMIVNNQVEIGYGNTISISKNSKLETGNLFTGVNVSIICHKEMNFGNYIMLGRYVTIYDSDYHPIYNDNNERINFDQAVNIGDNVWIGAKSMVLKGANIQNGAIVSANSMVMGDVEANKVFINKREKKSVGENVHWHR